MVHVENVHKRFGRRHVLQGVDLRVAPGEIVALLGPNGSGKSTLLKSIVGLLSPSEGRITVDGLDLLRRRREALARIGFVPQRVAFARHQTIDEVLAFYGALKRLPREAGERALERVGLSHARDRRVGELSGGMLQRLGLAQAILAQPSLLVLDEPTVGLDPHVSSEFRDLLAELNAEGTTILLTSHLLGEVERLAHRVAVLKEGAIAALDTVPGLLNASGVSSALWVRPTQDLAHAQRLLRERGVTAETAGVALRIAVGESDGLAVLDLLRNEEIGIETFWTTSPTLEEVYRWVVGKEHA